MVPERGHQLLPRRPGAIDQDPDRIRTMQVDLTDRVPQGDAPADGQHQDEQREVDMCPDGKGGQRARRNCIAEQTQGGGIFGGPPRAAHLERIQFHARQAQQPSEDRPACREDQRHRGRLHHPDPPMRGE